MNVIFLLALPAFVACTSPDAKVSVQKSLLQHGGVEREYWVRLPSKYAADRKFPLVFVLHGGTGLAERVDEGMTAGSLSRAADRLGVILVFPQGLNRHWQDGRSFTADEARKKGITPPNDADFIVALLRELEKTLHIDKSAVFAAGISNGGMMSFHLALEKPEIFAAVGSVVANLQKGHAEKKLAQPVSVIIFSGAEDPLMPHQGGVIQLPSDKKPRGEVLSAEATFSFFSEANGCKKKSPPKKLEDSDPKDETRVECVVHEDGREGTSVVLYSIAGGGHTWPGGAQYLRERTIGRVSRDIDASQLMLEFFLAHPKQLPAKSD